MKRKSFASNPLEEKYATFPSKESITDFWNKRLEHYVHAKLLQIKNKMMKNDLQEPNGYI